MFEREYRRNDLDKPLPDELRRQLWLGRGPQATPAIVDDRVYTMSAQGIVVCTDMANGKTVWKVDTQKTYRAPDGFFGMACSPLIEGNAVLLNIGGTGGAGIVALDKTNGKLLWKSLDDEASYSSPVISTLQGKRRAVFFTHRIGRVEPGRWGRRLSTPLACTDSCLGECRRPIGRGEPGLSHIQLQHRGAGTDGRHAKRLQEGVVQRHESLEPTRA